MTGYFAMESVATFPWNGWLLSCGFGGYFAVEYAGLFWILGFILICWFHYKIYLNLPLELPSSVIFWLNQKIQAMNAGRQYGLPLIPEADPPRYLIPPWIEEEKVYFWFVCFSVIGVIAHLQLKNRIVSWLIAFSLFVNGIIAYTLDNPFTDPLPRFFQEVTPFFKAPMASFEKIGIFMQIYPRMVFYYNAHYMWLHPPLLFVSYALVQMTFLMSIILFFRRIDRLEVFGYGCAKLAFFFLTVGMLLGYPWALKAWGPNWWWDPKIASSIMMWAVFSTYLHARLYLNRRGFWYLLAFLGVMCFGAVVFTFLASYYFPGEHSLQ